MFKIIETDWTYNPHPLIHQRQRFVGPLWVAWIILQFDGKRIPNWLGRLFGWIVKAAGAHLEIQNL